MLTGFIATTQRNNDDPVKLANVNALTRTEVLTQLCHASTHDFAVTPQTQRQLVQPGGDAYR